MRPSLRTTSALVTITKAARAAGYKVYWGVASRTYSANKDVGNTLSYRVPNLARNRTYYFSARAYNSTGVGPFGNEALFRT